MLSESQSGIGVCVCACFFLLIPVLPLLGGLNHPHTALLALVHHVDVPGGLVAEDVEVVANVVQADNRVLHLCRCMCVCRCKCVCLYVCMK